MNVKAWLNRHADTARTMIAAGFCFLLPAGGVAQAVEDIVPKEVRANATYEDTFTATAKVGASVTFTHNQNFVGQLDGQTWTFGANIDTSYMLLRKGHDWRSHLKLLSTFTYGPPINKFVKTADQFLFETLYLYHPKGYEWIGPFAKFTMDTAMFEGSDVRENPTSYIVTNETAYGQRVADGDINSDPKKFTDRTRVRLTESFMPMTLKQAAGIYARPIVRPEIEMIFLLGFGAVEVIAEGQYSVNDSSDTDEIDLLLLNTYYQGGLAGGLTMKGLLYKDKISYAAAAEFMVPFLRTADSSDRRSVRELTNVDIGLTMTFKLVDWASVDYVFKTVRQPQLVEGWQIQNMLMLTFAYNYAYDEKAAKKKAAEEAEKAAEAEKTASAE